MKKIRVLFKQKKYYRAKTEKRKTTQNIYISYEKNANQQISEKFINFFLMKS